MKPQTIGLIEDLFNKKVDNGWTDYQIKIFLMSPPYKYSERTAQLYMKRLREYIKNNLKVDKEYDASILIEELNRKRMIRYQDGDMKTYVDLTKEIIKLKGLNQEKVDITTNGENIIPIINIVVHKKEE